MESFFFVCVGVIDFIEIGEDYFYYIDLFVYISDGGYV